MGHNHGVIGETQMKTLLIIDIQNDYFPGGANELTGAEEALAVAASMLACFRNAGLPIVHVQHIGSPASSFFKPGTTGAEIRREVLPAVGEALIVKEYPSGFRKTALEETLRKLGADELVVCGMMTHMCVDTTVRAAADLGFAVTLIADACATKDLAYGGVTVPAAHVQAAYLAALDGTFAQVVNADELVI